MTSQQRGPQPDGNDQVEDLEVTDAVSASQNKGGIMCEIQMSPEVTTSPSKTTVDDEGHL